MSARSLASRVPALFRVALGTLLALAAFEPLSRLYYFVPSVFEPGVGPVAPAGSDVRWCVEGCASSAWQAHGVRRSRPYDPDRPALVVLGDSHTEALQVGDDDVYSGHLERALGGSLQVLDLGRSGSSAADYVALADKYKQLFHPRWTIVTLKDEDFEGVERGSYRFARVGGTLTTVPTVSSQMDPRLEPLRRHLALYSFAVYRYHLLVAAAQSEPKMFFSGEPILPPTPPAPLSNPREILAALARAYDGRVTFVYLSRPQPTRDGPPPIERAFDAACAELAASCVNPRGPFQVLVDNGTPPYGFANSTPNSGHLNEAGHAVLADRLAEELGHLALL